MKKLLFFPEMEEKLQTQGNSLSKSLFTIKWSLQFISQQTYKLISSFGLNVPNN